MPLLSPQDFAAKWRLSTLKERSAYQSNFNDVCALVGHPTPAEQDPHGVSFTFEMGAAKESGGQGWADVWKKGCFAWEYKGKHADLKAAYRQLLEYRESLQNPPLLIVSDIETIEIHTNFTNTVNRTCTITLDDLLRPEKLALLRAAFTHPEALKSQDTPETVTRQAAGEFSRLAALLHRRGEEPPQVAHFLIRLLFCLFAEDAELLPARLFTRLVERARPRPAAFAAQLRQLFEAMSAGGWFGPEEIRYFDGRLFDDARALELDGEGLDILAGICGLDWASIEPSIFGTLFERSLDPSKRAMLGAHYTSKEDILLIVEPVLMAPLRHEWEAVQAQARLLAEKRDRAKGAARTKAGERLASALLGFAGKLASVQVLDPACGSGNFLYVALRQLLDLWKEVSALAGELGLPRLQPLESIAPSPAQLHGIEVNEYAHQLAQATIWIGYIQWHMENGFGFPHDPILSPLDSILRMDAILAYDEAGRPAEPEWPAADVIVGNPPFLGGNKVRQELGDRYIENLFLLYKGRVPGFADLVCYWFEKARKLVEIGQIQRVGLLSTQAIRGGVNRKVLDRIKESGDIFWAQSDRDWILDGATVHVSMVGFDNGSEKEIALNGQKVDSINTDLTSINDLTKAKCLVENLGICFIGTKKAGKFDIDASFAENLLKAPINPNGRRNSDVIFPWLNGKSIVGREPQRWIIYFGEMTKEEAALYELPFQYVSREIYPERQNNNEPRARIKWWQHRRPAVEMIDAKSKLTRYIATPRVAKHRIFSWIPSQIICDDGVYIFARDDDYFFGVLHSRLHELWARATGTQLREAESGFRYTPTTTFETFPFPWPPGREPQDDARVQAIALAARELAERRDAWLNPPGAAEAELKARTLTNLYNKPPAWLELAHRKLDAAVFAAYGWSANLGDDEVLARLLRLNLERAGEESNADGAESAGVRG